MVLVCTVAVCEVGVVLPVLELVFVVFDDGVSLLGFSPSKNLQILYNFFHK